MSNTNRNVCLLAKHLKLKQRIFVPLQAIWQPVLHRDLSLVPTMEEEAKISANLSQPQMNPINSMN